MGWRVPGRRWPRWPTTRRGSECAWPSRTSLRAICLDVGHANANEKSAAQEALAAGDRLLALHLQDNDGLGQDQHLLPGRGTTDWDAFLRAMAELDGDVIHTFEVKPVGLLEATLEILAGLRDQWTKVV